jgi:hypothetical protein
VIFLWIIPLFKDITITVTKDENGYVLHMFGAVKDANIILSSEEIYDRVNKDKYTLLNLHVANFSLQLIQ